MILSLILSLFLSFSILPLLLFFNSFESESPVPVPVTVGATFEAFEVGVTVLVPALLMIPTGPGRADLAFCIYTPRDIEI